MAYKIVYKTGMSFISNAGTLIEAKKEAQEFAGYGYGSICILEGESDDSSGEPVAIMLEHGIEWIEPC